MKILICLFITITLSTSIEKKDYDSSNSDSDDSSSSESEGDQKPSYVQIGSINTNVVLGNEAESDWLNGKGKLRQLFALESALQDSTNNLVCSPVSALMPLGKLALGAKNRTHRELLTMIGEADNHGVAKSFKKLIDDLKHLPGAQLDIASKIYLSDKFELVKKFVKDSKSIFKSCVEKLSFQNPKYAAEQINKWVSQQTNGMIPKLVTSDSISPDASLVIVNAIHFKGQWDVPFGHVGVSDFYAPSGEKKTQMMSTKSSYMYTKSNILNAQIIEIPYQGLQSSFIIILPSEKNGLPILLNQLKLAPNLLNGALKKMSKKEVNLSIPKFSITTTMDLKIMYEKIGMKYVFAEKSGLSRIVKGQEVKISSAIQKAVIEVHERGTDAAAASVMEIVSLALELEPPVSFSADHAFLFFVLGKGEQLFAGIFTEP